MASPLSKTNLRYAIRELDEVAIAASFTGSGKRKLRELAEMGEEIGKALVGERPEVDEVRKRIFRRAHDVRVSGVKARSSARSIRALRDALKGAEKLVRNGLGDVPSRLDGPGKTTWVNVWGYTVREIQDAERTIDKAIQNLKSYGLANHVKGELVLDPRDVKRFSSYLFIEDSFAIDPSRSGANAKADFYRSVASRIWLEVLGEKERSVWGGKRSSSKFESALSRFVSGKTVTDDEMKKLRATVGNDKGWG